MKRLLLATSVILTLSLLSITKSEGALTKTTLNPTLTPITPRATAAAELRRTTLKDRADQEITRRVTSINEVTAKLNDIKKLTTDQKTVLSQEIQTTSNSLTLLKGKIDGDTDPTTLKTDVQSIVTSYRVYLLLIPKTRIIALAEKFVNVANSFDGLFAKLQARITTAQGNGRNVASFQSGLDDAKAKVSAARTEAQNAEALVTPLTPDGYPANATALQSAKAMLQTALQDLNGARADLKTIIPGLETLVKPATPSATSPL